MGFKTEITSHIAAGYSILYVQSYEELRARIVLRDVAEKLEKKFYLWSSTIGLCAVEGDELTKIEETQSPEELLSHLFESFTEEMAVIVLCDFHEFMDDPMAKRVIRELGSRFKEKGNNLIFLSPIMKLPQELKKDVTLVEFDLPNKEELAKVVEEVGEENEVEINNGQLDKVLEAVLGLTTIEAENALALSVYNHNEFSPAELMKTKAATIKKSGILEYFESDFTLEDVGGFPVLKEWLRLRELAFTKEAREYGIDPPKGALLLGVPGCGKTLLARAVANAWGMPLLKLDLGRVFGSLVGQSEENMRAAIQLAEAVAPCILFVDEIEKGLAGAGGGGKHDSGVTDRVFGTWLSWMQDKKSQVFVIATANNIEALPAPLLRKGRFDEMFFVDLPTEEERKEIFNIHLSKRNRKPKNFDLNELVRQTDNFTGSEIEEAVKSGLFHSFSENRELETKDIVRVIRGTVPLSKTMSLQLDAIRKWAKDRTVNVSCSGSEKKLLKKKVIRKIKGRGNSSLN